MLPNPYCYRGPKNMIHTELWGPLYHCNPSVYVPLRVFMYVTLSPIGVSSNVTEPVLLSWPKKHDTYRTLGPTVPLQPSACVCVCVCVCVCAGMCVCVCACVWT